MSWFRKNSLDGDPLQEQIGYILIEAAVSELSYGVEDARGQLGLFIVGQGWSKKEAERRLLHALSFLKGIPQDARDRAALISAKIIAELD
jgi:hypothetical protein